jgi:outer membrane scaffolding protein for murein synthesis (MipA/OmpV family)
MIRTLSLGLAAAVALSAAPAGAQPAEDDEDVLIVSFGVGPQALPEFPGSDEYRVQPLFGGHVRREGQPIPARAPDDGFGVSLTGRSGPIEIGPMVQFQPKRDPEDIGAAFEEVDFTFEPGAFVNFKISDSFRVRAEGRRGFGGHEGFIGDIGVDFFTRPGPDTLISIGPRVRLADSEYMETYFGVTPAAAAASGLPAYTPEGGVKSVGAMFGITHQLSRSFGIYGYAGYDRLLNDAADSPIVRFRGSEDQYSGGITLYYSFRMRNPFR